MEQLETVWVWWPAKFGERKVRINRADLNPKIHSLKEPKPERVAPPRTKRASKKGK